MICTHCNKRLTRKTARQINGVVMCSTCMFAPRKGAKPVRAETPKVAPFTSTRSAKPMRPNDTIGDHLICR